MKRIEVTICGGCPFSTDDDGFSLRCRQADLRTIERFDEPEPATPRPDWCPLNAGPVVVAVAAPRVLVHADGGACHGKPIVNGRCTGCGIAPDMQSTELVARTTDGEKRCSSTLRRYRCEELAGHEGRHEHRDPGFGGPGTERFWNDAGEETDEDGTVLP
jgi:hypothetical protein